MTDGKIRIVAAIALTGLSVFAQAAPKEADDAVAKEQVVSGSISGSNKSAGIPRRTVAGVKQVVPSVAYPKVYRFLVIEAMKSFQARDFRGAIAFADKADAILPPTTYTLNVRGAVAIEQLRFEEGKDFCMRALKLDEDFFPARFNLCEIPFNQRDYKLARSGFMVLYNETDRDDPTIELIVYRIFLTYLLDGDIIHAHDWLEKIPFPSQTPAYQYANAALDRKDGRIAEWREWLQSAEFIWPEIKRVNFADVLIHLGWLKDDLAPNDDGR